jgi:uncharacterized protein YndB with AHSA1/START domain
MNKSQISIERDMKSTPATLLWSMISSSHGLQQWFADQVEQDGKEYTFTWDGASDNARVIAMREDSYIRFRWEYDEGTTAYFELRMEYNELTDRMLLRITDMVDSDDLESVQRLWESQADTLCRVLGCV